MRTEMEKIEVDLRKIVLKMDLNELEREIRDLKKEIDPSLIHKLEKQENRIKELKKLVSQIS